MMQELQRYDEAEDFLIKSLELASKTPLIPYHYLSNYIIN
jgi:hypothetical protein